MKKYIVLSLLVMSFIISPTLASAQTPRQDQTATLIRLLQSLVQLLQQQLQILRGAQPLSPQQRADILQNLNNSTNGASFTLPDINGSWLIGEEKKFYLNHSIPEDNFNINRVLKVIDSSGNNVGILACAKSNVPREIIWNAHGLMGFCGAAAWGRGQSIYKEGLYKISLSNPPNPDVNSGYFRIAYPSEQKISIYPDAVYLEMARAFQMSKPESFQPRFYFSWIAGPNIPMVDIWLKNIECGTSCKDVLVAKNLENKNDYYWKVPADFPIDEKFVVEVSYQSLSGQRLSDISERIFMLVSDEYYNSLPRG